MQLENQTICSKVYQNMKNYGYRAINRVFKTAGPVSTRTWMEIEWMENI